MIEHPTTEMRHNHYIAVALFIILTAAAVSGCSANPDTEKARGQRQGIGFPDRPFGERFENLTDEERQKIMSEMESRRLPRNLTDEEIKLIEEHRREWGSGNFAGPENFTNFSRPPRQRPM